MQQLTDSNEIAVQAGFQRLHRSDSVASTRRPRESNCSESSCVDVGKDRIPE